MALKAFLSGQHFAPKCLWQNISSTLQCLAVSHGAVTHLDGIHKSQCIYIYSNISLKYCKQCNHISIAFMSVQ